MRYFLSFVIGFFGGAAVAQYILFWAFPQILGTKIGILLRAMDDARRRP